MRDTLVISAAIGLGLAALPTMTQANHCMMMKSYRHMGPMHSHGPRHYYPPMKHHGNHRYYDHRPYNSAGENYSYDMQDRAQKPSPEPAPAAAVEAMPGTDAAPDIIETAAVAQNFKILIRASEAVGLYDTLRGEGPFTVFAPSDDAFERLPQGTLEALLADPDRLTAVLSYHVVPERLTAADLLQRRELKTVQGQTLSIDQLEVATADIEASNGIIHAIDNVLVPTP